MGELSNQIEGLGLASENKLKAAKIRNLVELKKYEAIEIHHKTQLGLARIKSWQSMAELQEVRGINKQYAEALVKIGITDLRNLSITDAVFIVNDINNLQNKGFIPEGVNKEQIQDWQSSAQRLLHIKDKRPANLAPEVDIVWETMTCKSMRNYYESEEHPCAWFNGKQWQKPSKQNRYFNQGPFYAYDIKVDDQLEEQEGILHAVYNRKRYTIPELLSGCRKAPIMSVGLNPNLRGTTDPKRIYPYFDDLQQYAKHFRYRTNFKYSIDDEVFNTHLDPKTGESVFESGENIRLKKRYVSMYKKYEDILNSFQKKIGIEYSRFSLGEDVSYYNFVACHSPRWNMNKDTESGIIGECFYIRQFFIRQFRQSAPNVVIIFGKTVMQKFVEFFRNDFIENKIPDTTKSFKKILYDNDYVLNLDGKDIRIIFAPHPTGSNYWYLEFNAKNIIVDTLVEEYHKGNLPFNKNIRHLERTYGPCSFCNNPIFKIGECSYKKI